MKVLHILRNAQFAGIVRSVLALATAQHKNPELQVGLFFLLSEGDFVEKFKKTGIPCHFGNYSHGFDISPQKFLRSLHLFKKYDILHYHFFTPIMSLCGRYSRKKIVYTVRGKAGFEIPPQLPHKIKYVLLKNFLNRHVDYITFNSHFTQQVFEKKYDLNHVDRSVVYNGVPLQREIPSLDSAGQAILKQINGRFVIGTSSRFVDFKRLDRLLHAFKDFQKDKDAILLLVGDGAMRSTLEQLAKELHISEKTIFTGFKHNVRAFQNIMDVCVFPSENEPFGLAAIETLSLGKPTLVFKDGGGITEIIRGISEDDIVNDIPHLTRRLHYYCNNRDEIPVDAQRRIDLSKKFDIHSIADEFFTIYRKISSGR
jgi:glycosyltransferase involved in cell wall biosynthesis